MRGTDRVNEVPADSSGETDDPMQCVRVIMTQTSVVNVVIARLEACRLRPTAGPIPAAFEGVV